MATNGNPFSQIQTSHSKELSIPFLILCIYTGWIPTGGILVLIRSPFKKFKTSWSQATMLFRWKQRKVKDQHHIPVAYVEGDVCPGASTKLNPYHYRLKHTITDLSTQIQIKGGFPLALLILIYGCLTENISIFENTSYGPFPLAK